MSRAVYTTEDLDENTNVNSKVLYLGRSAGIMFKPYPHEKKGLRDEEIR